MTDERTEVESAIARLEQARAHDLVGNYHFPIRTLITAYRAAEGDAARLDQVEACRRREMVLGHGSKFSWLIVSEQPTIREALDAAKGGSHGG